MRRARNGFTIVEALVVLAIVGLLLAVILPAVQSARETARRTSCLEHLKQIGIGISNFESSHHSFPPGAGPNCMSFLVATLPQMEMLALYESLDYLGGPDDPVNDRASRTQVALFRCPSDPISFGSSSGRHAGTNYAGNFGSGVQTFGFNGMFRWIDNGAIGPRDVIDGLSQTVAVSEVLVASGRSEWRRVIWNTPGQFQAANQLELFADECSRMTPKMLPNDIWNLGTPWTNGNPGMTWYNHVLPPNNNSCYNRFHVPTGAYSAASMHPGGVNSLLADGSVRFVSNEIERRIWRALGSRNGRDVSSF